MKKHGNTLYITTQQAYINRDGENLVVSIDKQERLRLPIHTIEGAIGFGNVMWTPFALGLCGENGVTVSMLSESGRFMARLSGPQTGNILLRRAQNEYTRNPEMASQAARGFISGKIANTRTVLQRFLRDYPERADKSSVEQTIRLMSQYLVKLRHEMPLDIIRGLEGDAAKSYFHVFDNLILIHKNDFYMRERSRRPPLDCMNSLLSFLYTLLVHDIISACESVGLDPQMGFLHADRTGRPSLALDLMEEFRPWLADRLALSLINRGQITGSGFTKRENGTIQMNDTTRRIVLTAWKDRKDDIMIHPYLEEKMPIGLMPFVQAQLLARWLRGDLDAYPPIFWK